MSLDLRSYWLIIGWLGICLLVIFSLMPMPEPIAPGSDKLHHLLGYGLLSWWFFQANSKRNKNIQTAFLLAILGILIEFIQPFTNRYFEVYDILANISGIAIALLSVKIGFNLGSSIRSKLKKS